ncbi:MAG: efflux RND transporter permease subunit [Planctomycetota bacterium]|nr:efflux RND transporter permease subunit [Planctomycetota bacterium]
MTRHASAPSNEGWMSRMVRAFTTGPLSPVLLILSAAVGLVAVLATPREEEPQIVVPMADVMVSFPGASAEEVEQLVATPLEKLMWQIDGVEHVYSVSRRGGAAITVRFFVGEDRERALVRLQSKIEAHRGEAPPGVAGWAVRPVEIDDVPIVALTLWSESADPAALRRSAEELLARLEEVPDVSRTEILGGLPREVRVELDPEALAARELSPLEVAGALAAADSALQAGAFDRADRHIELQAGPFLGDSREIAELVVGVHGDRPVHVRDVAKVVDGPVEARALVRLGFGPNGAGPQGKSFDAVTLAISKKKGTNAVHVAEAVVERAHELAREILPSDVHLQVTRDWGETADEKVNELLGHLTLAIVTVIALVAFALGRREGLIVAAAVPVTFALTLGFNLLVGYSINRVTLFALVLVLGLVCDDPIVDVENIHRHFRRAAKAPLEAVIEAVNEVRPPVIVATLAVILSFVPLFFITGMMGPYMRPMAFNVPVAMAMSLLVAFTVTPWMSYKLLKPHTGEHDDSGGLLERGYVGALTALLRSKVARFSLWASIAVSGALAVGLGASGAVPLKMLPYDNKSEFDLVIDLPNGSTLEATDAAVRDIEAQLATVAEVTDFSAFIGTAGPIDFNGLVRRYNLRASPELAQVRVRLVGKGEREQRSHELALRIRNELQEIAGRHGATLKIVELPPGPPVLATLVAEVRGPAERTWPEIVAGAREVAKSLAAEHGVVDVDVMTEEPHARLEFELDREKAMLHGVSSELVTRTLALALTGAPVATVHEPHERQPLVLKLGLDREHRSGAEELGRLSMKGADGSLVPLAELGRFREVQSEPSIYHKDLARTAFVLGEVAGRPPAEIVLSQQALREREPLLGGLAADWSGEGEWQITLDVFRDLGLAFAGALVGIYVLLVLQTHSFLLPLVVMLSIPLGAIGILPGFWLLNLVLDEPVGGYGTPVFFTATGMIGMIALAGIVVRNSIILIDFMSEREAAGASLDDAVLESGTKRLRPILLTAGAAMLGAWPITLDPIFSGLAWSLIFGLVASTGFTLLVIPIAYRWLRQRARAKVTA